MTEKIRVHTPTIVIITALIVIIFAARQATTILVPALMALAIVNALTPCHCTQSSKATLAPS